MPLRVGIHLLAAERADRLVSANPERIGRLLRAEERGGEFDDATLLAAKVAVLSAVGQLSLFQAASFAITRVRGGHAAIPRRRCFEDRLVGIGASWVAVACGRAHEQPWALAVAMPGDVPEYDAAVVVRTVGQSLTQEERLDSDSLAEIGRSANPEVSRAARHAAAEAAEMLMGLKFPYVGLLTREGEPLAFTAPALVAGVPAAVAHQGRYVVGAVARESLTRRLRVDPGETVSSQDIL